MQLFRITQALNQYRHELNYIVCTTTTKSCIKHIPNWNYRLNADTMKKALKYESKNNKVFELF